MVAPTLGARVPAFSHEEINGPACEHPHSDITDDFKKARVSSSLVLQFRHAQLLFEGREVDGV